MTARRKRILIALVILVIAIVLISTTLGREIFAGRQPSLSSFSIINFAGYLFFLTMPVEALVPYYQTLGHPGVTLILLAVSTAVVAQIIDYGIGLSVRRDLIDEVIGVARHERAAAAIRRHGAWAILVFNLLPLSSPILLLVAGMMRYGLAHALLYSVLGLTCKYLALVYLLKGFL